ncbi:MAG: glycosyltransferase family 1 protein [Chloroflexota bacterium]|nr:MAG: glycosyltransferase family 1 protein [Chloroflexota bacterium]
MRVCIDSRAATHQGAGIGRFARGLISALARIDHETRYVLLDCREGDRAVLPTAPNFSRATLPLSDRAMTILWHRLHLPLPVELFAGPVDVLHSPDFVLPPSRRARSVVTVHDLSFLLYPECAEASLVAFLRKAVPESLARADLILADSASTRQDLERLIGVPAEKVEVVYGGVEERFRPVTDQSRLDEVGRKHDLPSSYILTVCTLEPRKNLSALLEAYFLLLEKVDPRPALLIAGARGWRYNSLLERCSDPRGRGLVKLLGYVDDADLPALLSRAELFVYPSLYEGFGLPPLEAMACGIPVVCSNSSSLPEVVGEAGLMVDPHDIEALAAAMERALTDQELRGRMAQAGLERAQAFTWENAARALLSAYEKVGACA